MFTSALFAQSASSCGRYTFTFGITTSIPPMGEGLTAGQALADGGTGPTVEAEGLVHGDVEIDLTAQGEAVHRHREGWGPSSFGLNCRKRR
jgi:hypothetical protein